MPNVLILLVKTCPLLSVFWDGSIRATINEKATFDEISLKWWAAELNKLLDFIVNTCYVLADDEEGVQGDGDAQQQQAPQEVDRHPLPKSEKQDGSSNWSLIGDGKSKNELGWTKSGG